MRLRGRTVWGAASALLVATAVTVAGCTTSVGVRSERVSSVQGLAAATPEFPTSLPMVPRGEDLWRQACPGCDAEGFTQTYLAKDRRQTAPIEIFQAISDGLPEKGLPALKDRLTLEQRWDVVFYIWSRGLDRGALATAEQAYLKNCSMCHGAQGQGDGTAAHYLEPRPADFTDARKYVHWNDVGLFQFVSFGKPGTAMPPWAEVLSVEERWALVDYLRTFVYTLGREE